MLTRMLKIEYESEQGFPFPSVVLTESLDINVLTESNVGITTLRVNFLFLSTAKSLASQRIGTLQPSPAIITCETKQ